MYKRFLKRLLDIICAFVAIIILSPLFLLLSLLIKLTSRGKIFYRQIRVGQNNKNFSLLKFRTMKENADKAGLLTIGNEDNRITSIGYYLRKLKIDELPQLFNVLKGDMSIVGPRPEVRKYVNYYTEQQLQILSVRPGLTDLASIAYINESELLAKSDNPEQKYIEEIMPQKLLLNAKYISQMSFRFDMNIIFKTLFKIIRYNTKHENSNQ